MGFTGREEPAFALQHLPLRLTYLDVCLKSESHWYRAPKSLNSHIFLRVLGSLPNLSSAYLMGTKESLLDFLQCFKKEWLVEPGPG